MSSNTSALQAAQQTLMLCQDGIKMLEARAASNKAIIDENNNRQTQWSAQVAAFNDNCNHKRNEARNNFDNYNNNRTRCWNDAYNGCLDIDQGWTGCNPSGGQHCNGDQREVDSDCRAGGPAVGQCWAGSCKYHCKPSEGFCRNSADQQCPNNPPNPNYDCGNPPPQPATLSIDTSPININCCSNISTILGSDVNSSTINQQNECLNNVKKEIQQIIEPLQQQPSTSTSSPSTTTTSDYSSNDYSFIIIIIVVVVISTTIIIGIVMYNSQSSQPFLSRPRPLFRPKNMGYPGPRPSIPQAIVTPISLPMRK